MKNLKTITTLTLLISTQVAFADSPALPQEGSTCELVYDFSKQNYCDEPRNWGGAPCVERPRVVIDQNYEEDFDRIHGNGKYSILINDSVFDEGMEFSRAKRYLQTLQKSGFCTPPSQDKEPCEIKLNQHGVQLQKYGRPFGKLHRYGSSAIRELHELREVGLCKTKPSDTINQKDLPVCFVDRMFGLYGVRSGLDYWPANPGNRETAMIFTTLMISEGQCRAPERNNTPGNGGLFGEHTEPSRGRVVDSDRYTPDSNDSNSDSVTLKPTSVRAL